MGLIEILQKGIKEATSVTTDAVPNVLTNVLTDSQTDSTDSKEGKNANIDYENYALTDSLTSALTDSNCEDDKYTFDDIEETETDPLIDFINKEFPFDEDEENEYSSSEKKNSSNIGDEVRAATGGSAKSQGTLAVLGDLLFDTLDKSKAQLCAVISGDSNNMADFTADARAKKALIAATTKYVQEVGVKAPTPAQTFLLAVGVWALPAFGAAGLKRFEAYQDSKRIKLAVDRKTMLAERRAKYAENKTMKEEIKAKGSVLDENENPGHVQDLGANQELVKDANSMDVQVVDFFNTKEYQDKRRYFERHATTGKYKYDKNGNYANVNIANELPSTEILSLLEAGASNAEIRELLYNETIKC